MVERSADRRIGVQRYPTDSGSSALANVRGDEENASVRRREVLHYDQALFDELLDLRSRLAAERNVPPDEIFGDDTLQQMAYFIPLSRRKLSRISGANSAKLEQVGRFFLSAIREYADTHDLEERVMPVDSRRGNNTGEEYGKPTGSTWDQTKQLLQQGLSLEEIANYRGLGLGTIVSHLDHLIQTSGRDELYSLMPNKVRFDKIRAALEETGGELLSPAKEVLGDDYTFVEIRLVWTYLRQQGDEQERPERDS